MVDGILTKLRNPVNQDLWLTDRFSTSVNHPLVLTLPYIGSVSENHTHVIPTAPTECNVFDLHSQEVEGI